MNTLHEWFSILFLGTHCSAHFACLPYLTHSFELFPNKLMIWIRCKLGRHAKCAELYVPRNKFKKPLLYTSIFQTCPTSTPALHIFYVSLIRHTWFNSSALSRDCKAWIRCLTREKMCRAGVLVGQVWKPLWGKQYCHWGQKPL